jgi:polysaccharide pyruvyl transferase WcaK-like protein/glycosyltransferase involved in cell wall biosynthesis
VSVVIPSYNARATLGRCLEALESQDFDGPFEVVVVDSSSDGTADAVVERFPWVRVHRSPVRRYPGDARNLGIAEARGAILAFTDSDCVVDPHWVREIVLAHRGDQPAIGGTVDNGNPESYVGWAGYFCEFSQWMPGTPRQPKTEIPTCCLSMKRWLFDRYGPFLEGTYCSDTAFHWKIGRDGHRPLFVPSIRTFHLNIVDPLRFLRKQVMHGRSFATVRVAERRLPTWRVMALALLSALLPPLLFLRTSRRVIATRRYARQFLRSAPFTFLGLVLWSYGEFLGYAGWLWRRALALRARPAPLGAERLRRPPSGVASRIALARNVFGNLGDEAMLQCEIAGLRAAFPECELVVLTDDPAAVQRRYGVAAELSETALSHAFGAWAVRSVRAAMGTTGPRSAAGRLLVAFAARAGMPYLRASCRLFVWNAARLARGGRPLLLVPSHARLLRIVASSDLLIGGGGLIPSLPQVCGPKLALYRAAALLGTPVVMDGQTVLRGVGAAAAYRSAACVVLRDREASRWAALAMGVDEARLVDGVDPAFALPVADQGAVEAALGAVGVDPRRGEFVALNVRRAPGRDVHRAMDVIARVLGEYGAQRGIRLLLFGMQSYRAEDDAVALEALRTRLPPRVPVVVLGGPTEAGVLKGALAMARMVISCRYHGAVFALTQGVPAIGVAVSPEYEVKLSGAFAMFDAGRFLLPAGDVTEARLGGLLDAIDSERDRLGAALRQREAALRPLAGAAYAACGAILASRPVRLAARSARQTRQIAS